MSTRLDTRPVPVLVLVVLVVLAVLSLGVTGAPLVATDRSGTAGAADASLVPQAGGQVCATGTLAAEAPADLVLLAAPEGDAASARGVVLTVDGSVERRAFGPLTPGALELVDVPAGGEGWLWAGWADLPVAGWLEWRSAGAPGEPRGSIASACLPTDPVVQTVLGLRTDGANVARLRIVNPFEADATFAVTFVSASGVTEPVGLRNVSVTGGDVVTVRLNDHVPEQTDIAAVVTVGAGRLAVEGLQRSIAAIGGVEGIATVAPTYEPSVSWTFPWLPVGPDVDSAIWVLNPAPDPVTLALTLHTSEGAAVPLATDLEVGAGEVLRIAGADLTQDDVPAVGVSVRSTTSAVIAAAGAELLATDPERSGLVRFNGVAQSDPEWVVAGRTAPDRDTVLHVLNLAEQEVVPRVTLVTVPRGEAADPSDEDQGAPDAAGGQDAAGGSSGSPEDVVQLRSVLEMAPIPPGSVGRIVLPLQDARAWSAVVTGGPALAVTRTTTGRGPLEPVALSATPSAAWRVTARSIVGRSVDGWAARIGGSADLRRVGP